ncbi:MAG TPA: hypothetical protein VGB71_14800 [Flavisolibacter sp.]|jgi:hypothetical protein
MKRIATCALILVFSAMTASAQSRNTKAVAKKPVSKEKVQKAMQSKKAKLTLLKMKETARKESE